MDKKNDELYHVIDRLFALEEENTLKDELFEKIKERLNPPTEKTNKE